MIYTKIVEGFGLSIWTEKLILWNILVLLLFINVKTLTHNLSEVSNLFLAAKLRGMLSCVFFTDKENKAQRNIIYQVYPTSKRGQVFQLSIS